MTASEEEIERAADLVAHGGLVAFPTETVYGLGADASDPVAVARIFAVKGRPVDHPLIVHLADAAALDQWASAVPTEARLLADAFWPGPITLLLARGPAALDVVTGGRATVGLRVPDHPVGRALLRAFAARRGGRPAGIAAPSANRFGRVSPTTAAHVVADLGDDVDAVLDGGPSLIGVESTIVDCFGDEPRVLRLGGVSVERLGDVLGFVPTVADREDRASAEGPPVIGTTANPAPGGARAPGMLDAHYAPKAQVEVVDDAPTAARRAAELVDGGLRVAVLAPTVIDGLSPDAMELEPAGEADDFARVLYDRLRQVDRLRADVVVVVAPPAGGLGDAVRDRLGRAAAAHPPR
ncbi:MAG TPA: L-threonylcarbamoyladenylate synthase [Acidimicrobiales bacterium]